ncbi:protein THYLAKOID ASSEMBLY 8, chloroplastic-like [Bidens hawaiensis]|uniref:protein THYLAKOID ASSEMBLY 8, chloroplastic-like n=1 Tax=Bidens hawaiensis TaxID=980011 RepID=UPI00404976CB
MSLFKWLKQHPFRTLSIEAIQAVKSLKRSHRSDPTPVSKTLSRLVKSDLIAGKTSSGLWELELELEVADFVSADSKGVVTLVKALLAADRADATVRVYEMMKSGGWRFDSVRGEYVGKVLSRGLRRLGKKELQVVKRQKCPHMRLT